jgi:hypothetical protein
MLMVRKAFEQELHDKYDAPAKQAIAKFIMDTYGILAIPNPDKYGVDLLVVQEGKRIGQIEVEVRQWSPTCPYPTIHVPERKTKFFTGTTLFFALTKDMQHAYWIDTEDIKNYPLKEVRNIKVAEGEMFYDVPTGKFVYIDLVD